MMLVKVDDKSAPVVAQALIKKARSLPNELRKSLTWDRGLEMAHHRDFSIATKMDVCLRCFPSDEVGHLGGLG